MNEIRHGTISGAIWSGEFAQLVDDRQDYGEPRINTTGKLRGRMVVITWTLCGDNVRVIAMRCRYERKQESGKKPWIDPDDAPELTRE